MNEINEKIRWLLRNQVGFSRWQGIRCYGKAGLYSVTPTQVNLVTDITLLYDALDHLKPTAKDEYDPLTPFRGDEVTLLGTFFMPSRAKRIVHNNRLVQFGGHYFRLEQVQNMWYDASRWMQVSLIKSGKHVMLYLQVDDLHTVCTEYQVRDN